MKKMICLLLISVMVLGLCSCSLFDLAQLDLPKMDVPETEQPPVEPVNKRITLNTYEITLFPGDTATLLGELELESTLKWKSSNEAIALVNSNGVITAAAPGVTNITCYADGADEAICTVTVKEKETIPSQSTTTQPQTETTYDDSGDFIFPHSSSAYLTEEEISATLSTLDRDSPTGNYAQDAINEIYARNGYVFQKKHTASYYHSQPWYTPNENFSTAHFNEYEKKNIQLLQKFS
ncbi:MAG: YARHG domain-containing protein [Oscillospiraceae bacterium]|nr:YARHG domain-containing protein [Oscillospiraceae bacterium]